MRNNSLQNTPQDRCHCSWKREERREIPPERARLQPSPTPSIFLALPVSPVACLADANSCHRVTAPRNTLRAEELATITKGAHGAGVVAAAKTEQSISDCSPEQGHPQGPVASPWAYLGPIQPGSQRRQDPVWGSQGSPCWQRGHGWRQPSPWNPGAQGSLQRVPFQPGWQARQKPSTGEQGWLRLQLPQLCGQRGTEVTTPALVPLKSRFPPTKSRFHPIKSLSIILDQGEIHSDA